ncbi:type II toxin-antitoxin system CcdA family antitoxin [Glaciecola sp. 1036]|uniref:type II toxin-antitoxin system CcdA family antitoxin n=1 Tax=Alteromonadaceae TaxID=72275 RepID=UPI003D04443E
MFEIPTLNYTASPKKRTNLSISESLLAEAKQLGINISSSAEIGIKNALLEKKRKLWLEQNKDALESSNSFVELHGLPFDSYRNF